MGLNGALGYEETPRDGSVVIALKQQQQHLLFTLG